MKKTLLSLALPLALMTVAHAQEQAAASPWRPVLSAGVTYGGDTIASINYTDNTTANIRAGSGLDMKGGIEYRFSPQFAAQATIGYHVHFTPQASNGDASFNRLPIELLGFYSINDQWRIGGGVRFVRNAHLSSSGAASDLRGNFENTTGGVLEVEYMTSKKLGVSLRYVNEKYKLENSKIEYSGNHLGLFANWYF